MAQIDLAFASQHSGALADEISFEMSVSNANKVVEHLAKWRGLTVAKIDDKSLLVSMPEQPVSSDKVVARHSSETFVIDLSEASTQDFTSGFKNGEASFELVEIAEYVRGYITDSTYVHDFNIASRVATQRSGDCTEHAVLSTALARSLGLPARMMVGAVIMETQEETAAFGHAWSEVWQDERWHIVDSALYGSDAKKHFYLPTAELTKETTGYSWALINTTSMLPYKISNLQNLKL